MTATPSELSEDQVFRAELLKALREIRSELQLVALTLHRWRNKI